MIGKLTRHRLVLVSGKVKTALTSETDYDLCAGRGSSKHPFKRASVRLGNYHNTEKNIFQKTNAGYISSTCHRHWINTAFIRIQLPADSSAVCMTFLGLTALPTQRMPQNSPGSPVLSSRTPVLTRKRRMTQILR